MQIKSKVQLYSFGPPLPELGNFNHDMNRTTAALSFPIGSACSVIGCLFHRGQSSPELGNFINDKHLDMSRHKKVSVEDKLCLIRAHRNNKVTNILSIDRSSARSTGPEAMKRDNPEDVEEKPRGGACNVKSR